MQLEAVPYAAFLPSDYLCVAAQRPGRNKWNKLSLALTVCVAL